MLTTTATNMNNSKHNINYMIFKYTYFFLYYIINITGV